MRRPNLRNLVSLAAAALIAFTARASLADHYQVPSGSMKPTVHVGDHIVVSKLAYGVRLPVTERYLITFGAPARGDVVVLDPPEPQPGLGAVLLKRVVAGGGETVMVRGGHVWVDGRPLPEDWASVAEGGGPDFGPARVRGARPRPRGQRAATAGTAGPSASSR